MKKIYFSVLLLTVSVLFSSCLKDELVNDQKYGLINLNANKIIGFNDPLKSNSILFENKDVILELPIHLSAENVASEDLKVTLSLANSAALVAAYNTANNKTFVNFPSNLYAIQDAGSVVTIPSGTRDGVLKIKVNSSTFDPAKVYALGFTITAVDKPGYIISGNYKNIIATFAAKNKYDGRYSVTNLTFNNISNAAHTANSPRTRDLVTLDGNTCQLSDPALTGVFYGISFLNAGAGSYYGNFSPIFTFSATTDAVTSVRNYYPVPNASNRDAKLDPTGVNKMTIVSTSNKTLEVSYIMTVNGTNTLFLKEKWTYTGSRP